MSKKGNFFVACVTAAGMAFGLWWGVAQYRECRETTDFSGFYCLQHAM